MSCDVTVVVGLRHRSAAMTSVAVLRRLFVAMLGAVIAARTTFSRPLPPPSSSSSSDVREFFIVEELPANSFVCNLVTELGLDRRYDPPVVDRLRFSFLTTPEEDAGERNYFAVDERSGVIHTTARIDREQLCPGGVVDCVVQYDVAVKPMEFFEIVKVERVPITSIVTLENLINFSLVRNLLHCENSCKSTQRFSRIYDVCVTLLYGTFRSSVQLSSTCAVERNRKVRV